ncbi:MAG: DUF892 family protein [Mucilaginibacter polytrichastri]|nr:DUF892 family protein [Mucilaginibacter polytrichastri]
MIENTPTPSQKELKEKEEIKKLFLLQLSEVIYLEHKLYLTFQEITRQAHCLDLKLAMEEHEVEISAHHRRLKEIAGMISFVHETDMQWPVFTVFSDELHNITGLQFQEPKARDLSLITLTKKIKSYEIACYHNLKYLASLLDMDAVFQLLTENFDEKAETHALLHELAVECYKNPVMYPDASSFE